jgi:hypothetical protein
VTFALGVICGALFPAWLGLAFRTTTDYEKRSHARRPPGWLTATMCMGCAPVAQLDRAPDYESGGRRFESFRARHKLNNLAAFIVGANRFGYHRATTMSSLGRSYARNEALNLTGITDQVTAANSATLWSSPANRLQNGSLCAAD